MSNAVKLYSTKADIGRIFHISRPTVYKQVEEIKEEVEKGRYNKYAISDNRISIAVFADYTKYRRRLKDRNLRKTVPPFNLQEALAYLLPEEGGDQDDGTAEDL